MNSIREELVTLDTNQFIFALRRDNNYPNCQILLFEKLNQLKIYQPLQVLIELQHNLNDSEIRGVMFALTKAKNVSWDYSLAPLRSDQKMATKRGEER
jgi:hypothetical protein